MNIVLVFPPLFANVNQPHAAIARLAGVLRQAGHEVIAVDLNLECVEWLVYQGGWAEVGAIIDHHWHRLEEKETLSKRDYRHYADLAWIAGRPAEKVQREFAQAADILRDPVRGVIWEQYDTATRVLSRFWLGVSLAQSLLCSPNSPSLYYGRAAHRSSKELLRQLQGDIRDPIAAWSADRLTELASRAGADLIGLSVTSLSQLAPALSVARVLGRDARVLIGGNIITRLADVFRQQPELLTGVYAAVTYEGEQPLLELAGGKSRQQTQNLLYLHNGKTAVSPVGEPFPINELPAPDFSGYCLDRYWVPESILPVIPGHGCDWGRCAFCNICIGYSRTQHRSPSLVVRDMMELHQRYGARLFTLYQESVSPQRLAGIARGLMDSGINVRWEATCELEPGFTPELCAELYRSGCRCLHFGLESIDPNVIARMERNIQPSVADQVLQNVSDAGIMNAVTLISGFPGETQEQAAATADYVIRRADVMHSISVSVYYISRGSPVDKDPDRYGVSVSRDPEADLSLVITNYEADGMTNRQRNEHTVRLSQAMQEKGCVLPADPPLLFAARYETNRPAEIYRLSKESAARLQAKAVDHGVRLRPWTIVRRLSFPLDRIRKRFVHPLSADEPDQHASYPREPAAYCLDLGTDRVVRLPFQAEVILELCDGRSEDELIRAAAGRLGLDVEQARAICRGLLKLYGMFIWQER